MKRLRTLLIILSLILVSSCMHSIYTTTIPEHQILTDTIYVDGTQNELYIKTNLVMIDLFVNADYVIQFQDKEAAVLKGKFTVAGSSASGISATVTINTYDDMIITNINPPNYEDYYSVKFLVDQITLFRSNLLYMLNE